MYDEAVHQISPGETHSYGRLGVDGFWTGLFAALPVKKFVIEHLAFQSDQARTGRPDRVALRFRAHTIHSPTSPGANRYGKHSGKPVEVPGIVHAELYRGPVLREWGIINDVAIWMQIFTRQA